MIIPASSKRPGDSQTATIAWNAVIRARGMVLDEMAARHRVASATEDPEVVALTKALTSARQRLAAAVVRGIRDDPLERYRRLLDQARSDKDRAERDLAEKSARFREGQSRSRVGLDELSAALPAQSVLVGFVTYRHQNLERAEATQSEAPMQNRPTSPSCCAAVTRCRPSFRSGARRQSMG
jgi:hypothetical protein